MIRLQKYLAQAGIASRRASERLILDRRVAINGETATTPGQSIEKGVDVITLDGDIVELSEKQRTLLLHKPRGFICSASTSQGKTIFELLTDIEERLFPIGRLDKNSEGLLLLTNDGELANRLTHPRYGQLKRYEVTVSGTIDDTVLRKLNGTMTIDDYQIIPATVTVQETCHDPDVHILIFELREGRNRQIRKMCKSVGLHVQRLIRTQLKTLSLGNVRPGQWRELTESEVNDLKN